MRSLERVPVEAAPARAREMRANGFKLREIAEALGHPRGTVGAWIYDPDGSKLRARKASYSGVCEKCGGPTSGGAGRQRAPVICKSCWRREERQRSHDRIIRCIQEWVALYGEPPGAEDWNPAMAEQHGHHDVAARYRAGDWPPASNAQDVFGSWNAAIRAAGFTPRKPGQRRRT